MVGNAYHDAVEGEGSGILIIRSDNLVVMGTLVRPVPSMSLGCVLCIFLCGMNGFVQSFCEWTSLWTPTSQDEQREAQQKDFQEVSKEEIEALLKQSGQGDTTNVPIDVDEDLVV